MTGPTAERRFGAQLCFDGTTQFAIWAPSVATLKLRLDDRPEIAMQPDGDGWFSARAHCGAGARYRFVLPDGLAVPDPASCCQDGDVHDASIVVDPAAYVWQHADWQGRPWHEAVILELHVGLCGGFAGVAAQLPQLAALGITAIELMPVADFPGAHNWGYDGTLPYAPDTAYGSPDALRHLVDVAHGLGVMVLLDVVYNHFGPDGNYLHAYAAPFFRADRQTPWGAGIDFRRPEVRQFFTQNACYWLDEFRIDGLRFDAVHAIPAPDFLNDLAVTLRGGKRAGRHIHLVLENEDNAAGFLRAGPRGALFSAQWNDDWHHCLHVLLTGEAESYYADFADATELLVRCLASGFAYQGQVSPHGGRPRGQPSADLPPTAFVNALQTHDQIGNRAMGERLIALAHPDALRAGMALLLLSPFIPMLFMGEEYGATAPFLFFTDHNKELADLVREGRRQEFRHFAAFADPARRAAIPDPNAPESFAASRPGTARSAGNEDWENLVRHLLHLRHTQLVAGIPGCTSLGAAAIGAQAVAAGWRLGDGRLLHVAINLGSMPVALPDTGAPVLFAVPPAQAGATELAPRAFIAFLTSPS